MRLIKCMHTKSDCYGKYRQTAAPVGIVVHSTGANNPNVKRYTQPSSDDANYKQLLSTIGNNTNKNSWNRPGVQKAVHYFIGKLADGSVATVQNLPEDISAWGVGKGKNGSYNYAPTSHIQFEVCEDGLTNESYFNAVYKEAVELCADICKRYNWDVDVIVSHKETYKKGYGSNHSDIDHWLAKFGKTMDAFRADVDEILHPVVQEPVTSNMKFSVGEVVYFAGNQHYTNANAKSGKTCTPGEATVTKIYSSGKHPYCLVRTSGSKSTVYGWVDAGDIKKANEIKEGDKVKLVSGAKWYNGKKIASWAFKKNLYVREIQKKNGKDLYLLSIYKSLPAYTGKVYADAIKLV